MKLDSFVDGGEGGEHNEFDLVEISNIFSRYRTIAFFATALLTEFSVIRQVEL